MYATGAAGDAANQISIVCGLPVRRPVVVT